MNKSKVKKLMWASLIVVASLIIIFVSSVYGIIFGFLTALIYCSIPAVLTTLAHLELNKGDAKTIEEFDAQEELNQHIKEIKKTKRQNWWKENKKIIKTIIIVFLICLCLFFFRMVFFRTNNIFLRLELMINKARFCYIQISSFFYIINFYTYF